MQHYRLGLIPGILLFLSTAGPCFGLEITQQKNVVTLISAHDRLVLTFISPDIVRVDRPALYTGPRRTSLAVDEISSAFDIICSYDPIPTIQTSQISIQLQETDGLLLVFKTRTGKILLEELGIDKHTLRFTMQPQEHFYGLGEYVRGENRTDVDYRGLIRDCGPFGNEIIRGAEYGNANMSAPILMSSNTYAFILDNTYKQKWDFSREGEWIVTMSDGSVSYYLIHGPDFPSLITKSARITGRTPMPPKSVLGMMQSEASYDTWTAIDRVLQLLRHHHFPVDIFLLDLSWYGGHPCQAESKEPCQSNFGRLQWDLTHFPYPSRHIKQLKKESIDIILIQHGYPAIGSDEYTTLAVNNCCVRDQTGQPVQYSDNHAWGPLTMIDFTNPHVREWVWSHRSMPRVKEGVMGFWLDMNEPPMYKPDWLYAEGTQADAHNLWGFYWAQSLYDGLRRSYPHKRYFLLSRSGTLGSHRFGVGFWSGDTYYSSAWLKPQISTAINMGFSGMAYWGTDIGGFQGDISDDSLYTRWFQFGVFNSIFRVHGNNSDHKRPTSPAQRGDVHANLAASRLRYALLPYNYTLAREVYETGLPFIRGLMMYYPNDPNCSNEGTEFLWGRDMLIAPLLDEKTTTRSIYLPEGQWVDFATNQLYTGPTCIASYEVPVYTIPIFVKNGSIIPMAEIVDTVMNTKFVLDPLIVRCYPRGDSSYELYEDDGNTTEYQRGIFCKTGIQVTGRNNSVTITIDKTRGHFPGYTWKRDVRLEIICRTSPQYVTLEKEQLRRLETHSARAKGWYWSSTEHMVYIHLPRMSMRQSHSCMITY